MYTGPKLTNDGLVFGYDTGYGVSDNHVSGRFYKGKPTANTWNKNTYAWTSGNITATRNATPPVPPPLEVQGFEVYKLQSNDGALNQGIMGTSNVVDGVGGAYVHSVYCYLESGTTVTVGQHWHPWAYGSSQTPPIGEWVRLSETVTNAVDNYGNIANSYRTNGIAYFTAPQYELGSDVSPHVDGTRSDTASAIDLVRTRDIDVGGASFDSTGQPDFDGTNDTISCGTGILSGTGDFTIEAVFKYVGTGNAGTIFANYQTGNLQMFYSPRFIGLYLANNSAYLGSSPWSGTLPEFTNDNVYMVTQREGTVTRVYLNGVLAKTGSSSSTIGTSSASFRIGSNTNQTEDFQGNIYVVKAYNKALTSTEIKQNFNAYKNRFNL
mgnify:CR=1 FL=1